MSVNLFDADYYRSLYPDLVAAGLDTEPELFNHFQSNGLDENREFSPLVSLSFYALDNPDLAQAGLTTNRQLYDHLTNFGVAEARNFSAFVDLSHYQEIYDDLSSLTPEEAFTHLKTLGITEEREFSALIDLDLYQQIYSDIDSLSPKEVFVHLVQFGVTEKRQFARGLDIDFYQRYHSDLNQLNLKQAFEHLVSLGREEKRRLQPSRIDEARSLGDISTPKTITNWVGSANLYDYYSFTLAKDGLVNLKISETSGNAKLSLLGLKNELLAGGPIIETKDPFEPIIAPKEFSVPYLLKAGTYYVEVSEFSTSPIPQPYGVNPKETTYTLNLSTTPQVIPDDGAGRTFSDAKNLGNLRVPQTLSNSFSELNRQDYYSFTLNEPSEFQVDTSKSEGNFAATLFKEPPKRVSQLLTKYSEINPKQTILLDAGTYYLEIQGGFTQPPNYKLNISATPKPMPIDRGRNTIDTATDLGVLTDRQDITDWVGYPDKVDYYKFTLNQADEVSVALEGLTGNVNVSLGNEDVGILTTASGNKQKTGLLIENFPLEPGVYYLELEGMSEYDPPRYFNYYANETYYNLSLLI